MPMKTPFCRFGGLWRYAWTRAHTYPWFKSKRADPEVRGRVGEAWRNIWAMVRTDFMPKDIALVSDKQQRYIVEWCDLVPNLDFNCGRYDLNLIKQHFKELLASTKGKVRIEKRRTRRCLWRQTASASLTLSTVWARAPFPKNEWKRSTVLFLSVQKSWLPYEWFDSPEKLKYPRPPYYPEFQECKKYSKKSECKHSQIGCTTTMISMLRGVRSLGQDECLLHGQGHRCFERCCQPQDWTCIIS